MHRLLLAAAGRAGLLAIGLAAAATAAAPAAAAQQPVPSDSAPAAAPAAEPGAVRTGNFPINRVVAVVGTSPILLSDVQRELAARIARRQIQPPQDSATLFRLMRDVTQELVDAQMLIQKAGELQVEVPQAEVDRAVDQQVQRVRQNFASEAEYREALRGEGFGTPADYRATLVEDFRRGMLQQRVFPKLREEGKLPNATVPEAEVERALAENREQLPAKPPAVSFRQIVIAPHASAAAQVAARQKADSLLREIQKGADFAALAREHSADPGSAQNGGDLGWNRRGRMVPAFDYWMFALAPGQLSPIVETTFGYHIIKVDRVQPAERKARHILITPDVDSADVERARAEAQGVVEALRTGAPFDSLVAVHHDAPEEKLINDVRVEQLPPPYVTAIGDSDAGQVLAPFEIPDPRSGRSKFVVLELLARERGGPMNETEARRLVREQLEQEQVIRKYLDRLRGEYHVRIMLEPESGVGSASR